MDTLLGAAVRRDARASRKRLQRRRATTCCTTSPRARSYNIIKAAEAGKTGNPGEYRDFVLPPPPGALRERRAA